MNKHKKFNIILYASLLVLPVFFVCMQTPSHEHNHTNSVGDRSNSPDHIADITSLSGNVKLLRKGAAAWSVLKPNLLLYSGDIIQTDKESRVELRLIDYGYITISEQSLFQVSVKHLLDSTKYAACNLKQGSILVYVEKLISSKRFVVRTPTALASIRGTSFITSVDSATGESKVQVLHGKVGVKKRTFKKIKQNILIEDSILAQNVVHPVKDFSAANIADIMNDLNDDWELELEIQVQERMEKIKAGIDTNEAARYITSEEMAEKIQVEKGIVLAEVKKTDNDIPSETMIVGGRGVAVNDTITSTEELSSDDIDSMKHTFSEEIITKVLPSSDQPKSMNTDPREKKGLIKKKQPKQKKNKKTDTIQNETKKNIKKRNPQLSDKWLIKGNNAHNVNLKLNYFTKAISYNPSNFNALYQRGKIWFNQNQFENAMVDFSDALSINPQFIQASIDRGTVYYNLKRYDEALADYSRAIAIKPDFFEVYVKRGIVYAALKLYIEAINDHTKAISINPNYALAYYHRGFSLKNLIQKNSITVPSGVPYHNRAQSYKNLKKFNEVTKNLTMYLNLCSDKNGIFAKNARAAITELDSTPAH